MITAPEIWQSLPAKTWRRCATVWFRVAVRADSGLIREATWRIGQDRIVDAADMCTGICRAEFILQPIPGLNPC
jgi:hypothetical protein